MIGVRALPGAAPLEPDGDEARRPLRRELADPDYYDRNPIDRLLTWLGRQLDRAFDAAAGVDAVGTFAAILVVVGLVAALGWLVGRGRRTARTAAVTTAALGGARASAAELLARAELAWERGAADQVVVDGFRALALAQIEQGTIDDVPQATAGELSRAMGGAHPGRAAEIHEAAHHFDEVLYGEHPASPEAARTVLGLARDLADARTRRRSVPEAAR